MAEPLPLSGRIALVTGASRGIGKASALALAKAGAHIIATARTQGALEELDDEIRAATGERATLVPLDLTQGDDIDILGGVIHQRFGKLDILFHAGAMAGPITPVSHYDPKQWDKVVASNLTATYRLIRSFEPLLKLSDAGRAIFVSSSAAVRPIAFWGGYAATKAGMETIVKVWADEMENTKIRTALLNPGAMRTKMRAEAFPGEDPMTLPDPSEIGPLVLQMVQAELALPVPTVVFRTWKATGAL